MSAVSLPDVSMRGICRLNRTAEMTRQGTTHALNPYGVCSLSTRDDVRLSAGRSGVQDPAFQGLGFRA